MKADGAGENLEQRGSRGLYGWIVNGGERMHGAVLEERLQCKEEGLLGLLFQR